jgi:hypothetical protein
LITVSWPGSAAYPGSVVEITRAAKKLPKKWKGQENIFDDFDIRFAICPQAIMKTSATENNRDRMLCPGQQLLQFYG